ncbi:hypothetical protein TWF696_006167 [Orbilia brochopaga]|uniref:DUS-like FMN-binding domain-containing protein n=1 Tax=Orbilia brochopaga TaxID=3140254 RepID=A0AAV9UWU9_9PEZI
MIRRLCLRTAARSFRPAVYRRYYHATMTSDDPSVAPSPAPAMIPPAVEAAAPEKRGMVVLAPMVRSGQLPMRLLSLKYGADLVWGPETIDKALIGTTRIENPETGCVDYMRAGLVIRLCPPREKSKLIFQLGTASPETAVEAAKIVSQDVSGIDVNSGCPKPFSTHAGMGAALLKDPDRLISILKALVAGVGPSTPYALPISVKIRLLKTIDETHALITNLCKTGISTLTLHCRTVPMRKTERAIRDALAGASDICRAAGVRFFVNGDVKNWAHAQSLIREYNIAGGAMIAIAAEANPSVFCDTGVKEWREVLADYLTIAMETENPFANTKFCMMNLVPGKQPLREKLARAKTFREVCDAVGMECTIPEERDVGTVKTQRMTAAEERDAQAKKEKDERLERLAELKRRKAEEGEGAGEETGKRVKMDVQQAAPMDGVVPLPTVGVAEAVDTAV